MGWGVEGVVYGFLGLFTDPTLSLTAFSPDSSWTYWLSELCGAVRTPKRDSQGCQTVFETSFYRMVKAYMWRKPSWGVYSLNFT